MAVSKHPTPKPSPPRRPPSDRAGQGSRMSGEDAPYGAKNEFGGYSHSGEHHYNEYGHQRSLQHGSPHKSEFEGGASFPKAGDTDTT